jgi:hypothetical protein
MKESTKSRIHFSMLLKKNIGNIFKLKSHFYLWDTLEMIKPEDAIFLIVSAQPTTKWNASVVGFDTSYRDWSETQASTWPVQALFNGKLFNFLLYDDLVEFK